MTYLIERIEGDAVTQVGSRTTERQALYAAFALSIGEYRIRHGDQIVFRFSVNRRQEADAESKIHVRGDSKETGTQRPPLAPQRNMDGAFRA